MNLSGGQWTRLNKWTDVGARGSSIFYFKQVYLAYGIVP